MCQYLSGKEVSSAGATIQVLYKAGIVWLCYSKKASDQVTHDWKDRLWQPDLNVPSFQK